MANPYEPPSSNIIDVNIVEEPLKRHGLLTAYLFFMIATNSIVVLSYIFGSASVKQIYPNISNLQIVALTLGGIVNVICAFAILKWRRWGIYGLAAITVMGSAINFSIGFSISQIMLGFVGIIILLIALNIGGNRRAWPRLK